MTYLRSSVQLSFGTECISCLTERQLDSTGNEKWLSKGTTAKLLLLDFTDRVVMARLDDLQKMGLTRPEAMVYAVLLSLGPSHARSLYRPACHTREETYRILRSLEEKGFVEVRVEKPLTFAAIGPEAAVSAFTTKINDERMERMKQAQELGKWLNGIRHSSVQEESLNKRNHFRILRGGGKHF